MGRIRQWLESLGNTGAVRNAKLETTEPGLRLAAIEARLAMLPGEPTPRRPAA